MSIDDGTDLPVRPLSWRTRILWGVLACTAYWMYNSATAFYAIRETARWPTTSGRIVSADVATSRVLPGGTTGLGAPLPPEVKTYPRVRYTYEVHGRAYSSGRIDLTDPEQLGATHTVLKYPPGTLVTVHYNPTDPGDSVLRAGWPIWVTIELIIGMATFFWSIYLLRQAPPPEPHSEEDTKWLVHGPDEPITWEAWKNSPWDR